MEVNLGKEYVSLTDSRRSVFLEDVLDIRFREAKIPLKIADVLDRSGVKPGLPMAREIKRFNEEQGAFYYHGIDTVADICSGDLAMALDLVKQICYSVGSLKQLSELKTPISARKQHDVIHKYSDREHTYLRYYPLFGKEMSDVANALCWLAHEAAVQAESKKDGIREPMIKTTVDIVRDVLDAVPPDKQQLLREMQKRGILFSLDTSRSRIENQGTERFQVRRILLVKYVAPLGRRDAIKIDTEQRLIHLLTEPMEFAKNELTGQYHIPLR